MNQDLTKKDDAERRRANKLSTKTKHKQAAAAAIIIAVVVNWRSPSSPVKRVPAELVDTRISKVNALMRGVLLKVLRPQTPGPADPSGEA